MAAGRYIVMGATVLVMGASVYFTVAPHWPGSKATASGKTVGVARPKLPLMQQVEELLAAKDVAGAGRLALEALKVDVRDVQANVAMGKVLAVGRKFEEADQHFDVASVLSRHEDAEILCDWGEMLMAADRARDAEAKFRQAVQLKEKVSKYQLWLGRSLRKQGRLGPAVQAAETARDLSPLKAEPCVELGSIYQEIKDFARSETYFRAALAVEAKNIAALTGLAQLLITTDDLAQRNYLDAAILLGNAVEQSGGRDVNLMVQQAAALALGAYYEQAIVCMEKAIAVAKEQGAQGETVELLLQTLQHYIYLHGEKKKTE
ncbi:MAG: hypothetical protein FWD53_00190 [Phycisphaerales bacterium]|nr:hypothetical protein [Phycisphaerales bacterium]